MSAKHQRNVFSKNLLHYLKINKVTQKEVANMIHVSPQTFNAWCQGIALPRMDKIQLLADYFNIKKTDLIDEPFESLKQTSITIEQSKENHDQIQRVLSYYSKLNLIGQKKLIDFLEDLVLLYSEEENGAK